MNTEKILFDRDFKWYRCNQENIDKHLELNGREYWVVFKGDDGKKIIELGEPTSDRSRFVGEFLDVKIDNAICFAPNQTPRIPAMEKEITLEWIEFSKLKIREYDDGYFWTTIDYYLGFCNLIERVRTIIRKENDKLYNLEYDNLSTNKISYFMPIDTPRLDDNDWITYTNFTASDLLDFDYYWVVVDNDIVVLESRYGRLYSRDACMDSIVDKFKHIPVPENKEIIVNYK